MRLSDAQKQFSHDVGRLLIHIGSKPGFACTLGDAFRDARVHGRYGEKMSYSSANSDHKRRLAIDLNLFVHDQYVTDTEAHREFGEFWESLHPDNYWGGHFNDGNHYGRHWPSKE